MKTESKLKSSRKVGSESFVKCFSVLLSNLIMPGKYTTNEEKARILAWRQENVSIKLICERTGRGRVTIMRILAAAKDLQRNTVPLSINSAVAGKKRHPF